MLPLFITALFLSCQLPDSGRMAMIEFNFTQPDILKKAGVSEVPDRIIPLESKTVVVVMYPVFSGDAISSGNIPTNGEINTAMSQPDARSLSIGYGTGFAGGSLENIEPGRWNFIVLAFESVITNLSGIDPAQALTFNIKKGVEITPGFNFIDLPLLLNNQIYDDLGLGDGPEPIQVKGGDSWTVLQSDVQKETLFIGLTGFDAGENRLFFNPLDLVAYPVIITLYSKEGYYLNLVPTNELPNKSYYTISADGATDVIYISARKSDLNPNELEFGYNGPAGYVAGPPHLLGSLSIFISGGAE